MQEYRDGTKKELIYRQLDTPISEDEALEFWIQGVDLKTTHGAILIQGNEDPNALFKTIIEEAKSRGQNKDSSIMDLPVGLQFFSEETTPGSASDIDWESCGC